MTKQNLIYVVAVAVVLGLGYFGYMKYSVPAVETPEQQQAKAEEQKNAVLAKVKALTVLPAEEPVLFTVNDATLLKGQQAFFKDAENGDVLLVFQKDGKALIYRESQNKIVNAGPISFQQPAATAPVKK